MLLFSDELLNEFITVSQRPKLKKYFSLKAIADILNSIEDHAHYIKVTSQVH